MLWNLGVPVFTHRARTYNASQGRFTSLDPIGFIGGDSDLYRYVNNGPIVATDPLGEITAFQYVAISFVTFSLVLPVLAFFGLFSTPGQGNGTAEIGEVMREGVAPVYSNLAEQLDQINEANRRRNNPDR